MLAFGCSICVQVEQDFHPNSPKELNSRCSWTVNDACSNQPAWLKWTRIFTPTPQKNWTADAAGQWTMHVAISQHDWNEPLVPNSCTELIARILRSHTKSCCLSSLWWIPDHHWPIPYHHLVKLNCPTFFDLVSQYWFMVATTIVFIINEHPPSLQFGTALNFAP